MPEKVVGGRGSDEFSPSPIWKINNGYGTGSNIQYKVAKAKALYTWMQLLLHNANATHYFSV